MSFRSVFLAVVIAFALILAALLVNRARPKIESDQPTAEMVRATGKCAECHSRAQYSVVHEYELSMHASKGVNCLDCHQPAVGQEKNDHHGFVISTKLTAGNCRTCHEPIYQQYLHSRHAAPSWGAIYGEKGLTPEQVNFSETYQPGGTRRPPHPFVQLEGALRWPAVRTVPQRRQTKQRRHDRQLHGMPCAAYEFHSGRPVTKHLRAVPHGS